MTHPPWLPLSASSQEEQTSICLAQEDLHIISFPHLTPGGEGLAFASRSPRQKKERVSFGDWREPSWVISMWASTSTNHVYPKAWSQPRWWMHSPNSASIYCCRSNVPVS